MTKISLKTLEHLQVNDQDQTVYYGVDQDWYPDPRRQKSGCGPSVACHMIAYLDATRQVFNNQKKIGRMNECVQLMDEVWDYVTPGERGIPRISHFYESFLAYARAKGSQLEVSALEIPEEGSRPDFQEVVEFIKQGLRQDVPVAFLNLCNGQEEELEGWHWVTIIEIDCTDNQQIFVRILDEGLIKTINLSLWYQTTLKGGGLVYFTT